jgi:hypothetical protein
MIRRITIDDIPDCFAIARRSYNIPFDEQATYSWGLMALHDPNTIAIRTEDGFGLAKVSSVIWEPGVLHGAQQFIAVRDKAVFQACKIMRYMRDWCCLAMGAVDYQFGEATGMRMDIIAKRLGAVENSPTFIYRRP